MFYVLSQLGVGGWVTLLPKAYICNMQFFPRAEADLGCVVRIEARDVPRILQPLFRQRGGIVKSLASLSWSRMKARFTEKNKKKGEAGRRAQSSESAPGPFGAGEAVLRPTSSKS